MHDTSRARNVARHSVQLCAASSIGAVCTSLAWAFDMLPNEPLLVLMAFLALLSLAVVSAIGAIVAYCQMSTASAFTAGLRTGMNMERSPQSGGLRLVE